MASDNKTLATFKIDQETWESFKAKARELDVSASSLMVEFIEQFLDGTVELSTKNKPDKREPATSDIDTIRAEIDRQLDRILDKRIEGKLEAILESELDDVIYSRIDSRIDTVLDVKIEARLDTILEYKLESMIQRQMEMALGVGLGELEAA